MTVVSAEIVHEARRELARRSLAAFCNMIEIPGAPVEEQDEAFDDAGAGITRPLAKHHQLLVEKLEAVERGDILRLMVFMPPGSAKSTYASVVFPVWFMGRKKRRNVICATYASDLARKIGRRARSILKQPVYNEIFKESLSSDVGAADEWALTNDNEFMAGGILSGITGNRADLIIIDDPIKGRQDADSETIRERTKSEYQDSILTRGKPGFRVVLIQTRWHQDDLAGSILPESYDGESGPILCQDGQVWEVICLPAEARRHDDPLGRKPGDMLWPEWFTDTHWSTYRTNPRTWSSLYQQNPTPDDGTYFPRSSFKRFRDDELPQSLRYYGTSDYAVTEDGGDYTRLRIWGVDASIPPRVYLIDGWGGQTTSDKWIAAQIDLIGRYRPSAWYGEAGVIQKAIEPSLTAKMRERRVSCRMLWLPSIHDKPTRARSAQAVVQEGRVYVRDDHDGDCFLDECAAFPAGRYDDDVDNLSLIGRALDQIEKPMAKQPERPRQSSTPTSWMAA